SNTLDHPVPVVHGQPRGRNRRTNSDADVHRTDDGASLPHGRAAALHRDGHDGRLRLNSHDETSLLEREELAGAAACPFWKNQERIPRTKRFGTALDGCPRAFTVVPLDGDEATYVESRPHDRKLVQLGLVENVQLRVKRLEQYGRIDITFVVRTEDHGTRWNVLPPPAWVTEARH